MTFPGFGEAVVDFYEGLEADNSKAYWTDNKALYDDHVRAPMVAMLADLEPEFGPGKVFRPYRDVRFAADKTPYKVQCGATVGRALRPGLGRRAHGRRRLLPDDLGAGRRASAPRSTTTATGRSWRRSSTDLRAEGFTVAGEQLKSRPRGVDPEHPRLELLRHKSLFVWCSWPPSDELHTPAVRERVAETWRRLEPLGRWLDEHVGVDLDDTAERPGGRRR